MRGISTEELVTITDGKWHGGMPEQQIERFCFDARQVQLGECFVALSGGARDGHDFVQQAQVGGAVMALVERPVDVTIPQLVVTDSLRALGDLGAFVRSKFTSPVVGITGSCGKTSTKEMLRILLGERHTHATGGNWNNLIGVPMTLFGLDATQHHFGVIEAGINQPGEMQQLGAMICADMTIVTNVGHAHLELLGSVENVAEEKARLATAAAEGSPVVIPASLLQFPVFRAMADRAIVVHSEEEVSPDVPVRQLVPYRLSSIEGGAAHKLSLDAFEFTIATPSRGIATNAALAIVAARQLGVEMTVLQERMRLWQAAGTRGSIQVVGSQTFYVDCYNANPTSMADALSAFVHVMDAEQPRAYVLGAMNELGATAVEQHALIGAQLQLRPADRAYFVGPDELVEAYKAGANRSGNPSDQLHTCESIEKVKSDIAEFRGALFLKGSRSYQLEKLLP